MSSQHAVPVEPLPAAADLGQLRRQAKDLRRAVAAGQPEARRLVAAFHPHPDGETFSLRDAQLTLARRHGFAGWHDLIQAVGNRRIEERDLHRFFGVEFNNEVWELLDSGVSPHSPEGDRDLALYGAFAAARHWHEVGTVANRARAEHLIARAALAVGRADLGLLHARRCLDLVEGHAASMDGWDHPFAHEALARALAATGDPAAGAEHRAIAVRLTAALSDPQDREILEAELARPPWFGLT